jgi:hypothetical protein
MPGAANLNNPEQGTVSAHNITTPTTVKVGAGILSKVSIVVAGAAGTINDCASPGAASTANVVLALPAAVSLLMPEWRCDVGITVVPGAAQVVAVKYS